MKKMELIGRILNIMREGLRFTLTLIGASFIIVYVLMGFKPPEDSPLDYEINKQLILLNEQLGFIKNCYDVRQDKDKLLVENEMLSQYLSNYSNNCKKLCIDVLED